MLLSRIFICAVATLLTFPMMSTAADMSGIKSEPLPEPLTLDLALELIDQQHPDLRYVDADLRTARSNLERAESNTDISVNIKASARWIEPSILATNQSDEDHRLGLFVFTDCHSSGAFSCPCICFSPLSSDRHMLAMP